MPTLLSHPVIPLALRIIAGREKVPAPLLVAGIMGSVIPDADVIGLKLGISYATVLGHRGFSHSLLFACLFAALGTIFYKRLRAEPLWVFLFLFLSTASHGWLDAFTDGGMGVAFFSPFNNERYFFPWQPIAVSPLSIRHILSERMRHVLVSELTWIWLPFLSCAAAASVLRRRARR